MTDQICSGWVEAWQTISDEKHQPIFRYCKILWCKMKHYPFWNIGGTFRKSLCNTTFIFSGSSNKMYAMVVGGVRFALIM